jgi:hypothetical protein
MALAVLMKTHSGGARLYEPQHVRIPLLIQRGAVAKPLRVAHPRSFTTLAIGRNPIHSNFA